MAKATTASTLGTRVTFQSPTSVPNTYNESVESWADTFSCWADVSPTKGALETVAQGKSMSATVTYTVTIRFNAKARTTQRIKLPSYTDGSGTRPSRYLTINAGPMDVDEGHAYMTFLCTEVQV